MKTLLTCPQGHSWQLELDATVANSLPAALCPICGAPASGRTGDGPGADSARWATDAPAASDVHECLTVTANPDPYKTVPRVPKGLEDPYATRPTAEPSCMD